MDHNKIPSERTQVKMIYTRRSHKHTDPILASLMNQKELTAHSKYIETSMNSVSYEKSRLRAALER